MNFNEHSALQEMVDNSLLSQALVIADRGYESYNNMAHFQEKGWFFLIRIKGVEKYICVLYNTYEILPIITKRR